MTEWIQTRRAGVVLASSLLAYTTGCSYAFVRGPPPVIETTPGVQQRAASECTTSNAAPVVDTVVSVPFIGLGGLAIAALIATSADSCSEFCFRAPGAYAGIAAASFALGAIFIASAATGYGRTADCRQAQEALPGGPHPSARYLLDVRDIAESRAQADGPARAPLQ